MAKYSLMDIMEACDKRIDLNGSYLPCTTCTFYSVCKIFTQEMIEASQEFYPRKVLANIKRRDIIVKEGKG